jgi:hypothetical protein
LAGIEVPHWRQLLSLASRCYEVTRLGYLGADMVLDINRGPLLLELNARPGLTIQVANDRGLLPRLRHVESLDELQHFTVEERVDYSIEHFAHATGALQPSLWDTAEAQGATASD